ncbi:MAG: dehydrogenase [Lentisphaerae bacterium RIFOXYB12_FULL_60_10]|nr:MAG: dehydrogenase [Lentisphaerae bacterium RIFOXYB12_FULL_60_10]
MKYKKASDVKVGVIGYGGAFNMGRHHLNEMKKAGMVPTAVAEIDPERLKVADQDFPGIERYATVSEMLRKSSVDMLAIITPHNTHAKLAIQCLKAGRHVVCEKPFAITTAECDAMITEARKHKCVLSTYHNRHWDGNVMQAVKVIGSGAIGRVVRIECHMGSWGQPRDWWRSSKSISGGVLYDWGVHLLEYSLQIAKSEVAEVSGFAHTGFWASKTRWKKDTTEDEGFAVVRFKSGAMLTLCISSIASKGYESWVDFTGTKGAYIMRGGDYDLITHNGTDIVKTTGANPPSEGWKLYQNVADHLVKGKPLVITPEWARRPIHILDLANQSAKTGRALCAKYG